MNAHNRDRFAARMRDEDDNRPSNRAPGVTFGELVEIRISRRAMLHGLSASLALGISGIGQTRAAAKGSLTFSEIPQLYDEELHVPAGHVAQVVIAWGDPVLGNHFDQGDRRPSSSQPVRLITTS
jgi:secreted PhoX family phosphatase